MPAQRGHWFPDFLPDGRHFVFFVDGTPDARGIYVGQLDSLESRRLFGSDGPAVYTASGYLFFTRDGALYAQGFDAERLELKGDPVAIAAPLPGRAVLSVSTAGSIVYRTPPPDERTAPVPVDRSVRERAAETRLRGRRCAWARSVSRWSPARDLSLQSRQHGHLDLRAPAEGVGPGHVRPGRRHLSAVVAR